MQSKDNNFSDKTLHCSANVRSKFCFELLITLIVKTLCKKNMFTESCLLKEILSQHRIRH